jgi:hypothetical protein
MSFNYDFNKKVNITKATSEVQTSDIIISLLRIDIKGEVSTFVFKDELTTEDYAILETLVANHDPTILPYQDVSEVSVVEIPRYALQEIDRTYIERSIVIPTTTDIGPHNTTFQFRYPIVLLGGDLYLTPDMIGDEVKVVIHFAPNDIVGALIEPASIGNNYIMANSESITNGYIWKTYELYIVRPDGSDYFLGECIAIEGNKIILDRDLTEDFVPGLYIKSIAVPIPFLKITSSVGSIRIGDGTTRGAYIPKDSIMECIYTNKSLKEKEVGYMIEYYA